MAKISNYRKEIKRRERDALKQQKEDQREAAKSQAEEVIFVAKKEEPETNKEGKIKVMHGGVEHWI